MLRSEIGKMVSGRDVKESRLFEMPSLSGTHS